MRLGIDFGTTHTVAAAVDRGNYPVVAYEAGDAFPSVVAVREADGRLAFGREALAREVEDGWVALRSFKRLLHGAGPLTEVAVGRHSFRLAELLTGHFSAFLDELRERSNLQLKAARPLQVAISVPAHAPNDQRFLTLDAFQRAGFEVVAVLNEPSAAGFEYAHRFRSTVTSKREYVLVYDLGGGTFDASLIYMAGSLNEVLTSTGVPNLGGDDLDEAILGCVLASAPCGALDGRVRHALLEQCRLQKEAVGPNTRRIVVDLEPIGKPPLALTMESVNTACAPLVERSLEAMAVAMRDPRRAEQEDVGLAELAGIYVVGGASGFPLVPRRLRERCGASRVRRSPHPFAATAIGLATFLDESKGYELADCLTRHFGVWREAEAGHSVTFDPIFAKDSRLPRRGEGPLTAVRHYRAAHNIGHFRFVECSELRDGRPFGHVVPWDSIRFAFDGALRGRKDLGNVPVARTASEGLEIEERYACSSTGIFEVKLSVLHDGYTKSFRIARPGGARARPEA
jgi:molecular chaperone DnaK (HSP70)